MVSKKKKIKLTRKKDNQNIKKASIEADDNDNKKGRVMEVKRVSGLKAKFQRRKNLINFGFWSNRNLKKEPETCFIIEMLYSNGTSKQFVLQTGKNTFSMKVGNTLKTYHLFYEECYFDISLNQYRLIYSENFTEPINREIMADNENSPYFSVSPDNLKDLIAMNYVRNITKVDEGMSRQKMIFIIAGIVILLLVLWYANKGG